MKTTINNNILRYLPSFFPHGSYDVKSEQDYYYDYKPDFRPLITLVDAYVP